MPPVTDRHSDIPQGDRARAGTDRLPHRPTWVGANPVEELSASKSVGIIGAAALGLGLALSAASAAGAAGAGTIHVPGLDPLLSDTRATGATPRCRAPVSRVWTDGPATPGTTNKVAEYVDPEHPARRHRRAEPQATRPQRDHRPGYQLVIDFDGDGSIDGILVGERSAYGNDWWASNSSSSS